MSSLFNELSDEIFQILKGSGRKLTLYDINGNSTYEPGEARRVWAEPDKMMVSITEAGSDSEVTMYLSHGTDINDLQGLINTLRQISTRYNVLLNVRKFGHILAPKDFAYQVEPVAEAAMFGSTKTSYQRIGETKLIVRHGRPVNNDITGSRSRNIINLFVETRQGERFRFPVRHLSGARAFAQHINQGGTPYDPTGLRIVEMAQESSDLAKVSRYIQYAKNHLAEEAGALRGTLRERITSIRSTLQTLSRPRGYKAMAESTLTKTIHLQEGDTRIGAEVSRLANLLSIDTNHALAETLLPVALLNLGENAMKKINEMFYEGLSVPADLMRELTETLATEYGYTEGADWSYVDRGTHNSIFFENTSVHADACDLLENILGCGFLAEDTADKFLAYATNWTIARNQAMGVGDVVQKDQQPAIQMLADGLKDVFVGNPVARPSMPAEAPSFASPQAAVAFKLALFLEPQAGLKNDALFNYISILVDKIQSGAKLSGIEQHVADALAGQVGVSESLDEEEIFESSDAGIVNYANKWVQQRMGAVETDLTGNRREEEKDMAKASAELADGLRSVFMGNQFCKARYPAPDETPTFTTPASQSAYELGLFLEPEAHLTNDALFTYISVLITKLQDEKPLSGPEKFIMDKIIDTLDDSAHIGADESVDESFGDYKDDGYEDQSPKHESFAEQFVSELDVAEMFKADGDVYADVTPADAEEYFVDATLGADDVKRINHTIGWYANQAWEGSEGTENMGELPIGDREQIAQEVWHSGKIAEYFTARGIKVPQMEQIVDEETKLTDREFEYDTTVDIGDVEYEVNVKCDVDHDDPSVGYSGGVTVYEVTALDGTDVLALMSPEQLTALSNEAHNRCGEEATEKHAEYQDYKYQQYRDRDLDSFVDEDVATSSFQIGSNYATDYGIGELLDLKGQTAILSLMSGKTVEVDTNDLEPADAPAGMREDKELSAWFEDFDPEQVLSPGLLDEYQLNPSDTRLATTDRVVHKAYGAGEVVAVGPKLVKVKFDEPHSRLPGDGVVSLSPSTLYKSTGGAVIRKEPDTTPAPVPGDKIRRKTPYIAPKAKQPGDKIRRIPRDGNLPEPHLPVMEEMHADLKSICDEENLQWVWNNLKLTAGEIFSNPAKFGLEDPENMPYDDTDEAVSEWTRRFKDILGNKLQEFLDEIDMGNMSGNAQAVEAIEEGDRIDELSKDSLVNYFDKASTERGGLEKAEVENGDENAGKKREQRDRGLGMAFDKMHEDEDDMDMRVEEPDGIEDEEECVKVRYDESDDMESGLVLPGDAGDAFAADVSKAHTMLQGDEGEYGIYGKKFKTRTFNTESAANDFVEANAGHRILGVKDGKVHVAETNDEIEEALGMERILKLAGRK